MVKEWPGANHDFQIKWLLLSLSDMAVVIAAFWKAYPQRDFIMWGIILCNPNRNKDGIDIQS